MKNRIEELYFLIDKYTYHYYYNNESLITDYEFDQLLVELKDLEEKYPNFKRENTPTNTVGGFVDKRFKKENHTIPMLSLDNVFSHKQLREFLTKIKEEINDVEFICELKIDGLAMSVRYDPYITKAVTRGDGTIGENVTHNITQIKSLPKKVDNDLEVRGEVYLPKKEFIKINETSTKQYANPRNLVAGTIRQLDNTVTKKRNVDMFCYGLVNYENFNHKSYYESMMFLKENNFKVNEKLSKFSKIDDVISYVAEIEENRNNLDYEIDGVVIKVNNYEDQTKLGNTAKYPKWAIAYKFKAQEVTTILKDVIYTVGRTGRITPNAVLEPVNVMGSIVSRATLHNIQYIKQLDLRINDTVRLIKSGDVIPRVESVVIENRLKDAKKIQMILNCPSCNEKLIEENNDHFCKNEDCSAKKEQKFIYFASKDGFNIEGLGDKIVIQLLEKKLVKNITDFFKLDYDKISQLDSFKEKSINNLLSSIEDAKTISLAKFLSSLAIENIGYVTAKIIEKEFVNINNLKYKKASDFVILDGIGEIVSQSLEQFFNDEENLNTIDELISLGVNIIEKEKQVIVDNKFNNKIIVITGSFDKYKRNDIKDKLETLGAKISSSVSSKTDYLFAGEKAGSKLSKAIELEVQIVNEDEINEIMEGN